MFGPALTPPQTSHAKDPYANEIPAMNVQICFIYRMFDDVLMDNTLNQTDKHGG